MELHGQFDTLEALTGAMSKLLPVEREVIRLIYQEEMDQDDVAERIHQSLRTVERRHASGLEKLLRFLVHQGVEGSRRIDI